MVSLPVLSSSLESWTESQPFDSWLCSVWWSSWLSLPEENDFNLTWLPVFYVMWCGFSLHDILVYFSVTWDLCIFLGWLCLYVKVNPQPKHQTQPIFFSSHHLPHHTKLSQKDMMMMLMIIRKLSRKITYQTIMYTKIIMYIWRRDDDTFFAGFLIQKHTHKLNKITSSEKEPWDICQNDYLFLFLHLPIFSSLLACWLDLTTDV